MADKERGAAQNTRRGEPGRHPRPRGALGLAAALLAALHQLPVRTGSGPAMSPPGRARVPRYGVPRNVLDAPRTRGSPAILFRPPSRRFRKRARWLPLVRARPVRQARRAEMLRRGYQRTWGRRTDHSPRSSRPTQAAGPPGDYIHIISAGARPWRKRSAMMRIGRST